MITHEEARKELEYFQQCVGLKLNKVNDYITQQEKVSKLLVLYHQLLKYIGLYNASTYCDKETLKDLKQKIKETQNKITALEEELK